MQEPCSDFAVFSSDKKLFQNYSAKLTLAETKIIFCMIQQDSCQVDFAGSCKMKAQLAKLWILQ